MAPRWVLRPFFGQIKSTINQGRATGRGISQKDPDLLVLDATGRATILAGYPRGVGAFLEEAGFIKDQQTVRLPQLIDNVGAQFITHCISIPVSSIEQVLHTLWSTFAHDLGQLPTILSLGQAQQAKQVAPNPAARLGTSKVGEESLIEVLQCLVPYVKIAAFSLISPITCVTHVAALPV
jgi:hypothetical protein